jgi:regulator of replication initiation timing
MYKERVESMLEENRKLVTETAVLNKNIENYKQVQEALEKKVSNLEKELQTYTKVKSKSAVAEAEMH